MSNVRASEILLKRLISTNGLAVRKSIKDEAFWYTSGKPGPFYINTENVAGQNNANEVLNNLNNILKANLSKEQQSKAIYETVNQVVNSDEAYDASIDANGEREWNNKARRQPTKIDRLPSQLKGQFS